MLQWTSEPKMKEVLETLFAGREDLLTQLFDTHKPQTLYNQTHFLSHMKYLSSGEYQLIELALHLWFQNGRVDLNALLYIFDPLMFKRMIEALYILRK